ncbi:hypothetical protein [Chroococcidiopsis cubana]|uniref:hypothetical protein n=1 Tax=Chroococcidiopsis cubana TaxID=171392 RepID=UPI0015E76B01|nr:hypothetical protein [Chroococcidiopsis cubana]
MTLCLKYQNVWRYSHITILPCHHSQVSYQGAHERSSSELRGAMKAERKVQRRSLRSCFALRSYEAKADRDR